MTPICVPARMENNMSENGQLEDGKYVLRLYVVDNTPKSAAALRNLEQLCEEHLAGRCRIEVIDLQKNPQRAREDQVLAVPTLVRKLPRPIRKIIGDLSNTHRVLVGLDLPHDDADSGDARKGEEDV
jgi:circadian clock protein KaiB